MGGDLLEVAEISFFELDRLFTRSARVLRRKVRKQRQKEREERGAEGQGEDLARSRSPGRKRKAHTFGGFTGKVDKIERTIVVGGLPASADEKILFDHFQRCGPLLDVRVVRNRHDIVTGVAVVEFETDDGITRAAALPPELNVILGTAFSVRRADTQIPKSTAAPKRVTLTRQQFTQQVLGTLKAGQEDTKRKLHIKNLRSVVSEDDMRGIFKPFGEFDSFEMGTNECWITFKNQNDAQDATNSMQGFQLVGQELQITLQAAPMAAPPPPAPAPPAPAPLLQKVEAMNLENDMDFGGSGGSGNASQQRVEIMKKLLGAHKQGGIPTVVGDAALAPSSTSGPAVPPTPTPGGPTSRTLLLQNMFSPGNVNLSQEPRFYEEIREDTHDECTKFGKVLHVTVDPRGDTGQIYVLYETPAQRGAAESALNGRWFEGKKIIAMGIDDSIWQALAAQAASSRS